METTDDLLSDALKAIELIRPAITMLSMADPAAGAIVTGALTLLYETLVVFRDAVHRSAPDEVQTILRAKVTEAVQTIAALQFENLAHANQVQGR